VSLIDSTERYTPRAMQRLFLSILVLLHHSGLHAAKPKISGTLGVVGLKLPLPLGLRGGGPGSGQGFVNREGVRHFDAFDRHPSFLGPFDADLVAILSTVICQRKESRRLLDSRSSVFPTSLLSPSESMLTRRIHARSMCAPGPTFCCCRRRRSGRCPCGLAGWCECQ